MKSPNDLVTALVREEVRSLGAYHVPDASGMIKLDAMENPFEWPESMRQEWLEQMHAVAPNRYPDPNASTLVQQIRQSFSVPASCGVLLGNGSDELIQMILMATAAPGRVILSPEPGFVMYRQISRCLGLDYVGVPLHADFTLDLSAMLQAIEQCQPSVIFLAYPNNPTGNLFGQEAVDQIIRAAPGLVVIDEAYEPFARKSYMDQAGDPAHLLVMRTVSKLGLAGLRLGFLVGARELIEQLNKIRLPYNINVLTQLSVEFALKHYEVLQCQADEICEQRKSLAAQLQALPGVEVFPSDANFILFRVTAGSAQDVFDGLKFQGVLIKNLSAAAGPLGNCLRVTVGSATENAQFMHALKQELND